jgi:16S rRNA (cytidine1402-2'-O)-methyltransferase
MNISSKRQNFPKGLWIVATPIGNLLDMTPRALQALEMADLILCEDTRRTQELLTALSIKLKKLERYDAHASEEKTEFYVGLMLSDKRVAFVTDAGTPALSDPGAKLVKAAGDAGLTVTPFPGPSAVTALLSVVGIQETAFTFRGFFPKENSDRAGEIKMLLSPLSSEVFVWYESPQRIEQTLEYLATSLPDAVTGVVGKELTKIHERLFRGAMKDLASIVKKEIDKEGVLGEWSFVLHVPKELKSQDSLDWVKVVECLLDAGVSVSDASKKVSQHFGTAKNEAYEVALQLKDKKKK